MFDDCCRHEFSKIPGSIGTSNWRQSVPFPGALEILGPPAARQENVRFQDDFRAVAIEKYEQNESTCLFFSGKTWIQDDQNWWETIGQMEI